jgi:hypothetical protein
VFDVLYDNYNISVLDFRYAQRKKVSNPMLCFQMTNETISGIILWTIYSQKHKIHLTKHYIGFKKTQQISIEMIV